MHIDAGKEDCYHQYVQAGATFYVSFSVSKRSRGSWIRTDFISICVFLSRWFVEEMVWQALPYAIRRAKL